MRLMINDRRILFLALTLAGCALQVTPNDLIGDWQMTEEAVQRLGLKQVQPKFRLNRDGSFQAENLPSTAFRDSNSWKSVYTGAGSWKTPAARRTQGFASLVLDFNQKGPNQPTGLILHVDKDSRGLYVFTWLDEEGGERLIYRR